MKRTQANDEPWSDAAAQGLIDEAQRWINEHRPPRWDSTRVPQFDERVWFYRGRLADAREDQDLIALREALDALKQHFAEGYATFDQLLQESQCPRCSWSTLWSTCRCPDVDVRSDRRFRASGVDVSVDTTTRR